MAARVAGRARQGAVFPLISAWTLLGSIVALLAFILYMTFVPGLPTDGGWTLANWAHFRKPTWPRYMHDAPPHMQANALFRFVWHFGIALPDQDGSCTGY